MAFLCISMGIAAVTNFGLSHFSHEHDDYYKQLNIMDIITLAVIVLLALGIGLWLIFRSSPDFDTRYSRGVDGFKVDDSGNLIPKSSFNVVDSRITNVK